MEIFLDLHPLMDRGPGRDSDFESKIEDWQAYVEGIKRAGSDVLGGADSMLAARKDAETCSDSGAGSSENRSNTNIEAAGTRGPLENSRPGGATSCESIRDDMIDAPVIEDASGGIQPEVPATGGNPDEEAAEDVNPNALQGGASPKNNKSRFIEIKSPTRFIGSQTLGAVLGAGSTSPKQYKYRRISFGSEELLQDAVSAAAPLKSLSGFAHVCRGTPKPAAADLDSMKGSFAGRMSMEASPEMKGVHSASIQYMNGTIPSDVSQEILDYMETKIKLQNVQIEAYKENIRRQEETISILKQELRLAQTRTSNPDPTIIKQLADHGLQLIQEMRDRPRPADLTTELTRERLTVESLKNVIQELVCKIKNLQRE